MMNTQQQIATAHDPAIRAIQLLDSIYRYVFKRRQVGTITQAEGRRLLHYDADSGRLSWRESPAHSVRAGAEAGTVLTKSNGKKYRYVSVNGKKYYAHRLAWLYVHGYLPEELDHINGDGLDNRLDNLREVTHEENGKNVRRHCTNTSGHTGVHWANREAKWRALIVVDGKHKHLGYFTDIQDAIAARATANHKYGFHDNHGQDRPL